jgi:hypothetical protein
MAAAVDAHSAAGDSALTGLAAGGPAGGVTGRSWSWCWVGAIWSREDSCACAVALDCTFEGCTCAAGGETTGCFFPGGESWSVLPLLLLLPLLELSLLVPPWASSPPLALCMELAGRVARPACSPSMIEAVTSAPGELLGDLQARVYWLLSVCVSVHRVGLYVCVATHVLTLPSAGLRHWCSISLASATPIAAC